MRKCKCTRIYSGVLERGGERRGEDFKQVYTRLAEKSTFRIVPERDNIEMSW
jgi:hypothetical protein